MDEGHLLNEIREQQGAKRTAAEGLADAPATPQTKQDNCLRH